MHHLPVALDPCDPVILRPNPAGKLTLNALRPSWRLWLLATGPGFAPFASVLHDPETWERHARIVVMHTCRTASELAYGRQVICGLKSDRLIRGMVGERLHYHPATTRETSPRMGRITDALATGRAFFDLRQPGPLTPETDRVMVCGSMAFNRDMAALLRGWGLREGSNAQPGDFVLEKAFAG
jgi:ferredoxin/flavodoxin---NADP+ reductase